MSPSRAPRPPIAVIPPEVFSAYLRAAVKRRRAARIDLINDG